jgi:hypothetical protein
MGDLFVGGVCFVIDQAERDVRRKGFSLKRVGILFAVLFPLPFFFVILPALIRAS